MKKRVCFTLVAFFTIAAFLLLLPTPADSPGLLAEQGIPPGNPAGALSPASKGARARIESSYGKLPLSFERNQGQTSSKVKFLSRGRGYSLFLTNDEAVLALRSGVKEPAKESEKENTNAQAAKTALLRMKLAGANQSPKVAGLDELPGKSNYFIGKNPKNWHTNVPNYAKVRYQNVYPGIDLVYYGNQRQLEYDFVVAPGADPKAITLEIAGTKDSTPTSLAENGDLVIKTGGGEVRFHKPVVYQAENPSSATSNRKPIEGHFVLLAKNRIGFEVSPYDTAKLLYIDPVISYITYLGTPNREAGEGVAVDAEGNAYVVVTASGPAADPPFPPHVLVNKINASGSAVLYSTVLGGSTYEVGSWIAVDSLGNAYVTGETGSDDFPTTENAYQKVAGGGGCSFTVGPWLVPRCTDVFFTKLNAAGSGLLYSTYLGGTNQDHPMFNGIAIDAVGNAYVAGVTQSSDFPTVNPIQPAFHGGTCGPMGATFPCPDGFVAKINPTAVGAASLVYSTYLGGGGPDELRSVAVDSSGNAYVAGQTQSPDFPTTNGAFQTAPSGPADAFVTKINSAGSAFAYSTFLGGAGWDQAGSVGVDSEGNAYVTGMTNSVNFPTTEGAFDTSCGTDGQCNGMSDTFVTKLNADGSDLVYSTFLGGSAEEAPFSIAVDSMGIAYVTGRTISPDFPMARISQPIDALFDAAKCGSDPNYFPCADVYVAKLTAGGEDLIFSTYQGGHGNDVGNGIAVDSSRNAYIVGMTDSFDFPMTTWSLQPQFAGFADAFIVKFSDLARSDTQPSVESVDFGEQVVGTTSESQRVTFKNYGDAPEPVPPLDVTGDFQFTHTCGTTIPPGTSCTADFTFTPTETGTRTGAMRGYDEESGEWYEFLPLTGVGILPALGLSPPSLDFKEQKVGTTSEPQTVTVTNTGTAPVTISDVKAPANFTVTNNCGSAVAAGGGCTLGVAFAPTATGSVTEQIAITYVGAGSPQSVTVTGTGTAPAISASPASLSFKDQLVGSTSDTQTITLTNTGTAAANFSSIKATGDFAVTDKCGSSLAAGENCTLDVAFSPKAAGSVTEQVTVAYDGADSPLSINLTGAGIAPALSVSPSGLTFEGQLVGTTSAAQTVTVTNTGTAPVNISGIEGSTHFAHTHNCGTSLAAAGSCTINVTFAPQATGPVKEQITVTHDGAGSPQSISLSGTGTDFSIVPAAGTEIPPATVTAGEKATYNLSIMPTGFAGSVAMVCTWKTPQPQAASCSVSPATVNLDGTNAANLTVSVTTTTRSVSPVGWQPQPRAPMSYPVSHLAMWLLVLAAVASLAMRRRRVTITLASVLFLAMLWTACGGGSASPPTTSTTVTGTPAGTYSLSVSGTASGVTHSIEPDLTLVVK